MNFTFVNNSPTPVGEWIAHQICQTFVYHGLTITGISLDDIFNKLRGKLITEVAMFA